MPDTSGFAEFLRATGPAFVTAPGKRGPNPECIACEGTGWIPRCDDDGREVFVRCPCPGDTLADWERVP